MSYNDQTSSTNNKAQTREWLAQTVIAEYLNSPLYKQGKPLKTVTLAYHAEFEKVLRQIAKPLGIKTEGFCIEGKSHIVFEEMKKAMPSGYVALWGDIHTLIETLPTDMFFADFDECGAPTATSFDAIAKFMRIQKYPVLVSANYNIVGRGFTKYGLVQSLIPYHSADHLSAPLIENSIIHCLWHRLLGEKYGVDLPYVLQYNGGKKSDMFRIMLKKTRRNAKHRLCHNLECCKLLSNTEHIEMRPVGKRYSHTATIKAYKQYIGYKNPVMVKAGQKAWETRKKRQKMLTTPWISDML